MSAKDAHPGRAGRRRDHQPLGGTTPELGVAAVLVGAAAVAGYAMAGWPGLTVVAVATAAIAMVVLRILLPQPTPDVAKTARQKPQTRTLTGYSHRRFVVHTAMTSQGFYNSELRPVLEHLLAARLAERHGVNLYQDPEAARRLLCRDPRDADLWRWIDPATRPASSARGAVGRRAWYPAAHPGAPHRPIGEALMGPEQYRPGDDPDPRRAAAARPSWTSSSARSSAAAGPSSWC